MSMAPDLLSVYAASLTKKMRIGSGGIMLPNYSPLKVAENYLLLESLYPQRIDLGLGRASGTDQLTALALQSSQERLFSKDFGEQLNQLLSYFSRDFDAQHPFRNIKLPGDASLTPDYLCWDPVREACPMPFNTGWALCLRRTWRRILPFLYSENIGEIRSVSASTRAL